MNTPNPKEEKRCDRCGLSKSEWKGRWQDPICKVGKTSYETHTDVASPQSDSSWEEETLFIEAMRVVDGKLWLMVDVASVPEECQIVSKKWLEKHDASLILKTREEERARIEKMVVSMEHKYEHFELNEYEIGYNKALEDFINNI